MTVPYMSQTAHKVFLRIREKPGVSRSEVLLAVYGDNSRHENVVSTHVHSINKIIANVNMRIVFRGSGYYLEDI